METWTVRRKDGTILQNRPKARRFWYALLAVFGMSACTWTPVVHHYPSGMSIARVDQLTLDGICSHTSDEGKPIKHAFGCYDSDNDILYILNNCEGAESIPHELAHKEKIANPKKYGYNW